MDKNIRAVFFSVCAAVAGVAGAAPSVGDTYVYRVINAYNNEVQGEVAYRVDRVDAGQVTLTAAPDRPSLGAPHTDVLASDANWLRHTLINHDMAVEYSFSPAFPAYVAPLDAGKSWSTRVSAVEPVSGLRRSVRVDGDVLGAERITTPAGAFDTIKVRRRVYAGDFESSRMETNITETDWYAPALGRAVRTERNSGYIDQQKCANRGPCTPVRGDWQVFELVSYSGK